MIPVLKTVTDCRDLRQSTAGQTIGLVPTMGHLHAGHEALIRRSVAENDVTVVSIYVNAKQFNRVEDFESYPITLAEDLKCLEDWGASAVFLPDEPTMYPDAYALRVHEVVESQRMEGAHRPGHFEAVLTVVMKLFHLVQPQRAYFGEKDYQQYRLIAQMVEAFFMPVEVVPCPTVRNDLGVAHSSRNSRLSVQARKHLAHFSECLQSSSQDDEVIDQLVALGFEVEYVATHEGRRYAAVQLEGVRLIDNVPRAQEVM